MPFAIIRQDITRMTTDAIVNAANPQLQMGGGVCGAIFKAAGAAELQAACNQTAPIRIGEAVMTPGFRLPARWVIHTAGPVWSGGLQGEDELLRACYLNSLQLAAQHHCDSIAFPLISSGIYGYPKKRALQVATQAIRDFLAEQEMSIWLVVFDRDAVAVSEQLSGAIERYIDANYIERHQDRRARRLQAFNLQIEEDARPMEAARELAEPLDDLIGQLDEPFALTLFRLIDRKGKTDVEVYKRANLDRKHFSKIRTVKDYMPGKRTIIALAIAMELTLDETEALLKTAGFALSHSHKFDVIVEYFILHQRYDILEINEVLFRYDQPLLGG